MELDCAGTRINAKGFQKKGCFKMNQMQKQVEEFHQAFGVPVNQTPQLIDSERCLLRAKLISEEAREAVYGMGFTEDYDGKLVNAHIAGHHADLTELADGLADLLYVTFGACLEFGIDIQAVFDCVHESNMSKMWTRKERQNHIEPAYSFEFVGVPELNSDKPDERCYIAKRADGKIIKSPSYSPADIKSVLEKLKGKSDD